MDKPLELRLIAHRGNLNGPDRERENGPHYLDNALDAGYDVELDLWKIDGNLYLGHDAPHHPISPSWLTARAERVWVHCKNLPAVDQLVGTDLNWFFHENDALTLTSRGFVWCYPGQVLSSQRFVYLNFNPDPPAFPSNLSGVCADYLQSWRVGGHLPATTQLD